MKKQSILVIDDSLDMLVLQKMILERDGYKVVTANSGTEAFEVLSRIDEPDLILLDMQMEDMSGPDLLNMLAEKKPKILKNVPVVFVSGSEPPPMDIAVGFIHKFPEIEIYLAEIHRFTKNRDQSISFS
jgi:CheY-like chemotaxis protein